MPLFADRYAGNSEVRNVSQLIGLGLSVADRGRIPIGVEARHAADRHDDRYAGLVKVLERVGLDVPAAVVVAGPQPIQQVDGMTAAGLEPDGDAAAHRRRRDHQGLHGQTRSGVSACRRRTARDANQARKRRYRDRGDRDPAPRAAQFLSERHALPISRMPSWRSRWAYPTVCGLTVGAPYGNLTRLLCWMPLPDRS